MAKKKKSNLYAKLEYKSNSKFKRTTIGGKINKYKTSSLNKRKRRQLGL